MSTIQPEVTLGALVNEHPRLAPQLERLGLDYCCGGQQTLVEAATERGLDVATVLASLDAAGDDHEAAEWPGLGLSALVEHIVDTHHAYLHSELPRLDALATKVANVHGARHPELDRVRTMVLELRADLEPHLLKEERVLFPMIRQIDAHETPTLGPPSVRQPIAVMLADHEVVGDLLADLRTVTDGFLVPDDGCASYRALYAGLEELEHDTHLHVHKENNLLFPRAAAAELALAGGGG